ncbi:sensor histidine kinase [Streptomyces armeniacus]|uniref:histidine kinase n=1 Tax=Streptomyces armeniacus TaxID=83291 RepID=A0A345XRL1_9ACTN|nr:sensor histidine kinase [Streptomyces armeniacus]AXK34277.1 sensor histidine kinase [Streptomyces armeniacus]
MSTSPPPDVGPGAPRSAEQSHGDLPPPHGVLAQLHALGQALTTPASSTAPLMAHAPRTWMRRLPYGVAFVFALILIPSGATVLAQDYDLPGAWAGALAVAQGAPLLLAVTRPLHAWWVVITADVVCALALLKTPPDPLAPWPWPPPVIIGYLMLCLALALRENRRTLVGVWLVTTVASLALGFVDEERSEGSNVLLIVLSAVALLVGAMVRERGDAQRRLAEQETISEAERAQRTLLEERNRIARELHDVVAHHMSVITVQADSAPYRIDGLPGAAREEFDTIAATARESLAEMRRLLGVLRSEETRGERAPQPGLDRVPQLVQATVRAGVPVELSLEADAAHARGIPQAVELSAYRVVQEALANVVRHAPGAGTRVTVTGDRTHLMVLVVNGPSPTPHGPPLETSGTGHGLVGMRERVRLVGGTLDTGPLPDAGFRVAARLPLTPPEGPEGKEPSSA